MEMIPHIVLVDDHALFRNGLRQLLEREGFVVAAEAANGGEFLAMLPALTEEKIVLLDIDMPGVNGFEAARQAMAARPDLKIITLSMHGEEEYYFQMVSLGVKGFLLKNSEISEVVTAIRTVAQGGSYFSHELLFSLVGSLKSALPQEESALDALSPRELEILLLICKGLSNQEIGDKLFISKRTVDKHRANILEKTGSKNTANLVVYAIKNGLVAI